MFGEYAFSLKDLPYGWIGSFVFLWNEGTEQKASLVMATTHAALDLPNPAIGKPRYNLLRVGLTWKDQEEDYTVQGTPTHVVMRSGHGWAEACIDENDSLRIRSHQVSLVVEPFLCAHEIAKSRNDGSWEVCFGPAWKVLIQPVSGSMKARAEMNFLKTTTENVRFDFLVSDSGSAEAAIHLYESNMLTPKQYASFDSIVKKHERTLAEWLKTIPQVPKKFEKERIITAYCILSNLTPVCENFKVPTMLCGKIGFALAMAWHQSYAAIALHKNTEVAWNLLKSVFYHQDPFGMLPDWFKDTARTYMATKPPIQGYALLYFIQHADLSGMQDAEFVWMYDHLEKLHNWWMSFRDTDHDGIPQYDSGDEAGWDDATVFSKGVPVETPDLSTYLIFVEEALSALAHRIGLECQAAEWKEKSESLLRRMIAFFWNGDRFVAKKNVTHEVVECWSTVSYQPLLLGQRLPQNIRDKMIADLSVEGDYLTPFGFASERLDSPLYHATSWLAGSINSAMNFQLCFGLWDSGAKDLARKAAERFVENAVKQYWPFSYDSYTGERLNRPSSQLPLTSWMSALFLALAGEILSQ